MTAQAFAAALRAFRQRHGMTQPQLGAFLGVSGEAVSKWERGLGNPAQIAREGGVAAHG